MVIELRNNRKDYIALAAEPGIRADLIMLVLSIQSTIEHIYDI